MVKKIYIEIPASSNSDVLTERTTSRKTYKIIPPTQSQPKQVPVVLLTNPIEETEINENDPENIDVKLVPDDLPKLSPPELLSLEKFHREQSLLPYNRALIFVPESVDFLQSNSVDTNLARLSLVPPLTTLKILNKQNINDVRSFIRITRKIKPLPVAPKSVNVSNRVKANLMETIKKPSVPKEAIIKKEDLRSVESAPLVLPIQSKLTTDDNTSRSPSQRVAATKKHVITSSPKLPVKKSVPTATHKKLETEFPWDNFDNNENGADTCKFGFNIFLL